MGNQTVKDSPITKDAPANEAPSMGFAAAVIDYAKAEAVVELLGRRKIGYTRDEIIHGLGTASGGDVTRMLSDLEECGFIRKYMPSGQGKNGGMYQLVDSYTLFYFSFVKGSDVRDGE